MIVDVGFPLSETPQGSLQSFDPTLHRAEMSLIVLALLVPRMTPTQCEFAAQFLHIQNIFASLGFKPFYKSQQMLSSSFSPH